MKTQQTTISEVSLIYRSKVKASDRPQVKCSKEAYNLFMNYTFHHNIIGKNGSIYVGAASETAAGVFTIEKAVCPDRVRNKVVVDYFPALGSHSGGFYINKLSIVKVDRLNPDVLPDMQRDIITPGYTQTGWGFL